MRENPDATLQDIGSLLGVSRARAGVLLQMAGMATQRQRGRRLRAVAAGLFSGKELQIISCIDKGYTNRQIAKELRIGYSTAKNQVAVIIGKLDAQDREDAVAVAYRRGFLPVVEQAKPGDL